MTFRLTTKLILVAFGLILLAATLGGYGLGRIRIEELVGKEQQTLSAEAELAAKQLTADLQHLRQDTLFLSTVAPIQGIVRARAADGIDPTTRISEEEWRQRLTMLFEAMLKYRPDYFQIRFIGVADNGKELVRVERNGSRIVVTAKQELQSKGDRYYVGDTMALPPGQVYMSPIDLNREHGQIEVPHIPTMRVATPIYSPEGEPFGMVIINVNMGAALDRIANTIQPPLQVYVVNNKGDYLLHPDRSRTFGFDLGNAYRIQDDFPILNQVFQPDLDAEQRPLRQPARNGIPGSLLHYLKVATDPIDPSRHLAIVVGINNSDIAKEQRALLTQHLIFAVVITITAMIVTLWLLRRVTAPLARLTAVARQISAGNYSADLKPSAEPEINALNHALGTMADAIADREHRLHEANEALEQRVAERTAELRTSEANLATAQRIANLGSWDWDIVNGSLHWSDEIYRIFGLLPREFSATYEAFLERIHPNDRTQVTNAVNEALAKRKPYAIEHRILRSDGEERVVFEQGEVKFHDDGTPCYMHGTVLDITERKRDEERIRLLAGVFEHSLEGMLITDAKQNIMAVNRSFTRLTGYLPDEVIGKKPKLLGSGWHDKEYYEQLWRSLTEHGVWKGELRDRRKNGELYVEWLTIIAVKNDKDEVINYIGMFEDVTQEKEAEERIAHLAYHDTLTDLANRRLFEDRLEQALRHAHRALTHTALLFVDLDRFKPINDTLGHKAGDLLLKEVARRLSSCVRDSDTAARLGGDEFAVILHSVDQNQATHTAQRILDALSHVFRIEQHDIFIGASIGIAIYPSDGVDVTTLVKHADIAMYQAKQAGRNTHRFFKPEMNIGALERLQLENDLRRAIEQQEFELYYQPQVDIASGRIVGAEALVRWHHPERGLLTPAAFIRTCEETGLIVPLGEWVLEQACRQTVDWQAQLPEGFRVAVNLSARQFQPQVLDTVRTTLERTGASPHTLELELTESMVMQDPDIAIGLLRSMADLGILLAIDDFGTGYSSLSHLKRFPLHKLKVDRSFVQDIPGDANDAAITIATIALGRSLNMAVIAEGVETSEQLAFLRQHGCDQYQGYYCSHPVPATEFLKLLAKKHCIDA